jgi:hypothetical protein
MDKNQGSRTEDRPADPRQGPPGGDPRERHKPQKDAVRKPGQRLARDSRDRSDREAIERPVQLHPKKSNQPNDTPPAK